MINAFGCIATLGLEERIHKFDHYPIISPSEVRCRNGCKSLQMRSAVFKHVDLLYRTQTLSQRRIQLDAPSKYHLCKSILMKNSKCSRSDCKDPNNSKYYLVMLQYMAKLDCQKLYHVVRDFTGGLKKYYNFHVAPGIESEQLTGFLHNGVSPFGTLTSIPVIIDKGIASLKPAFFYFGGGDIDTKLGCSVEEFLQKTGARVADVANPRDGDYEGKDTKLDDDEDDDEDDVCEKESIEEK